MGFLLFFFCLPFPFLMFACLFETNFPNIPFFKPKLLSLLAVYFFFCCSCFCFHGVCFSLSVSMLACFWYFVVFHLCFCFVLLLVLLSVYEENCFPCNSGVFWVMLLKRVVCFFLCFFVLFLFVFLVLFVSIYRTNLYYFVSVLLLSQD